MQILYEGKHLQVFDKYVIAEVMVVLENFHLQYLLIKVVVVQLDTQVMVASDRAMILICIHLHHIGQQLVMEAVVLGVVTNEAVAVQVYMERE